VPRTRCVRVGPGRAYRKLFALWQAVAPPRVRHVPAAGMRSRKRPPSPVPSCHLRTGPCPTELLQPVPTLLWGHRRDGSSTRQVDAEPWRVPLRCPSRGAGSLQQGGTAVLLANVQTQADLVRGRSSFDPKKRLTGLSGASTGRPVPGGEGAGDWIHSPPHDLPAGCVAAFAGRTHYMSRAASSGVWPAGASTTGRCSTLGCAAL
jgi:hypothetical protein